MNAKNLASTVAAAVALLGASTSFAADFPASGEFSATPVISAASTVSRSNVQEQARLAVQTGALQVGNVDLRVQTAASSDLTRDEVRTQARQSARFMAVGERTL